MALKECISTVDAQGRELLEHGTALFPAVCYHDDLETMTVPWHWHDEIETSIVEGPDAVISVGGETCRVRPGDGFFINSQVMDLKENAAGPGRCRLRAVLYHARLVGGGVDSIFYQGYLQPLLSDPCRPYIVFRQEVPWEREVLQAEKIVRAYREQSAAGVGVFTVDGKMIDIAFIPGAERTLKLAKACGMYEGDL